MKWIVWGILGAGTITIAAFANQPTPSSPPVTFPTSTPQATPQTKRLTITVSVQQLADLKVKVGQTLKAGDLVADRTQERQRLNAQRSQLELTAQRLRTMTISPPSPPAPVPAIAALPDASYLEAEAQVEKSKALVEQVSATVSQKKQEIEYLAKVPNLNSLVLEHETAKLQELELNHTAAIRDYQLSMGKLDSAQRDRRYQEYQQSLDVAERVEARNRSALEYQQQWAAYEQRQRDREYQVSQTQLKLNEVTNAIATLSVVRAPAAGKVRRIKWLGQGADGRLSAELTLITASDRGSASLPSQPSGLSGSIDSRGDRPEFGTEDAG